MLALFRYYFMCVDWLAVDQSDGSVERVIPVAANDQIAKFGRVFASTTKKDLSDGHLWFSRKNNALQCFTLIV